MFVDLLRFSFPGCLSTVAVSRINVHHKATFHIDLCNSHITYG